MRTVEVEYKVYKFEELDEEVQAKVLDEHRQWNVECLDWWDCVVEDFKDDWEKIGFNDIEIFFSGFSSQGDGACFEANCDLEKLIKDLGDKRFYKLLPLVREGLVYATIERNSYANHYSHERTRYLVIGYPFYHEKHPRASALCKLLEEYLEAVRLDLSRDLYQRLEKEYDYLTSDEAIKERIECSEIEFLKSGKIF